MQRIHNLIHALTFCFGVLARRIQHIKIAHQQHPAYSRARKPGHQRFAHLPLRCKVTRRQRRQQGNHRRAPCCALLRLVGITQPA
ncbi:hypothetical protein D3C75_1162500 [compost metagenome]